MEELIITEKTPIKSLYVNGTLLQNQRMKLFAVDERMPYDKDAYNVIYINGSQLAHYDEKGQMVFDLLGKKHGGGMVGAAKNYGHIGDLYSSKYRPIIAKYIPEPSKEDPNYVREYYSEDYGESLLELLEKLKTKKNIVIGKSYGGLIAGQVAQSNLVQNVYAVNPPVCGTPLADPIKLDQYRKSGIIDLFVTTYCKNVLEEQGFQYEDRDGLVLKPSSKIHCFGGSIKGLIPTNPVEVVMTLGYNKIMQITGKESDGVVIWDPTYFEKLGINYHTMNRPFHSNQQAKYYVKTIWSCVKEQNR